MGRINSFLKLSPFFLFCFTSSLCFATSDLFLIPKKNGGYNPVKVEQFQGVRVNSKCFSAKKCDAKDVINAPAKHPQVVSDPQGYAINPASSLCHQVGGASLIISDVRLNQSDACLFKDGSFLLSMDLWKKFE